jgi:hypothetical protein
MPVLYCVESSQSNGQPQVSFITRISPITLETELNRLREAGMTFNETDIWAIIGVLLLTTGFMEQNMNYHKAICLKNVFVSETKRQIHLLNPFVLDAYLDGVINKLINPIERIPGWRAEFWTDESLRLQASGYYPEIKSLVQASQMDANQMSISVALIGLQLASGLNEDYFLAESSGNLDKMRINQAIDSIQTRYSTLLRTFFRSIFSAVQKGEILSPSKLFSSQPTRIKTLINNSISESAYTNEIFQV